MRSPMFLGKGEELCLVSWPHGLQAGIVSTQGSELADLLSLTGQKWTLCIHPTRPGIAAAHHRSASCVCGSQGAQTQMLMFLQETSSTKPSPRPHDLSQQRFMNQQLY